MSKIYRVPRPTSLDRALATGLHTSQPFSPRDPVLKDWVISALLTRIELKSPSEAAFLKQRIKFFSAIEQVFPLQSEKGFSPVVRLYCECFKAIAASRVPKGNHARDTVTIQRNLLVAYLEAFAYPKKSRSPALRLIWMQQHVRKIATIIGCLACYCFNPMDDPHHRISDLSQRLRAFWKEHALSSHRTLVTGILGEMHSTSSENIRKLLRPL